jgi:spore coat polysaccharide biosynthesis predicted glycosyltransferase SpsG
MKKNFDIIFYCDANKNTGFGHASRCAHISFILHKYNANLKIGIIGDISKEPKKTMKNINNNIKFINYKNNVKSKIAFIDKMFNFEKPSYIEDSFIEKIKEISDEIVLMFSGIKIQSIDKEITYIGYHPIKKKYKDNNIKWGIQYAPTNILKIKKITRNHNNILIALGGYKNNDEIKKLILSINLIKEIKTVDVLLSPVNKEVEIDKSFLRKDLKVSYLSNVKTLSPYLASTSIVITSFGNLFYEALAHKTPTLIVAQKSFQMNYAKLFEEYSNILNLGFTTTLKMNQIKIKIKELLYKRGISKKKPIHIPENGIVNIANIINLN